MCTLWITRVSILNSSVYLIRRLLSALRRGNNKCLQKNVPLTNNILHHFIALNNHFMCEVLPACIKVLIKFYKCYYLKQDRISLLSLVNTRRIIPLDSTCKAHIALVHHI